MAVAARTEAVALHSGDNFLSSFPSINVLDLAQYINGRFPFGVTMRCELCEDHEQEAGGKLCRRCAECLGPALVEEMFPALKPCTPTRVRPGPERVEVYARRYQQSQELYHPEDALVPVKSEGKRSNVMSGMIPSGVSKRVEKDRDIHSRLRVRMESCGQVWEFGSFDAADQGEAAQDAANLGRFLQSRAKDNRKRMRRILFEKTRQEKQ